MSMKLYVGNLGEQISSHGLEVLFAQVGTVESAQIVTTNAGNSLGFGFVAMGSREEGAAAIAHFDGREIRGQRLIVNEEKPPKTLAAGVSAGNRSHKESSYITSRALGWFQD